MYKLVIKDDEANKTVIAFYRQEITIGRAEGNTIRLTEQNVSRKHAKLIKNNNIIYLEDLNSYVGTYLNEEKIESKVQVKSGDEIKIGDYIITLIKEAEDDDETVLIKDEEENKSEKKIKPVPISEITGTQNDDKGSIEDELDISQPLKAPYNKIIFLDTNLAGTGFDIAKTVMTIGKSPEADIVINSKSLADIEAKLISSDNRVKIKEVSGKKRMKINDDPYTILELREGDIINLGGVTFRYCDKDSNYVYKGSSSSNSKLIVIALVVILLLGGGVFWLLKGSASDKDKKDTVKKEENINKIPEKDTKEEQDLKKEEVKKVEDLSPELMNKFSTGKKLIEDGQWTQAETIYNEILNKMPDNKEAKDALKLIKRELDNEKIYSAGVKLFTMKKFKEAIDKFNSLPEDNYYGKLYKKKKKYYFDKIIEAVNSEIKKKNYKKAREYLIVANEMGYDDEAVVKALKRIDKILGIKNKNTYNNKKTSKKTVKRRSSSKKTKRNTGVARALFEEGKKIVLSKPMEAIKKFEAAIKNDPFYPYPYLSLGIIYKGQKKNALAIRYLKKYLKLKPNAQNKTRIKKMIETLQKRK